MTLARKTAGELVALYRSGSATPDQTVEELKSRIASKDGKLNCYVAFDPASGGMRRDVPRDRPLWGVPVAMKDNICVEGQEATCASKILKGYVAPYNATVTERLLEAGAILLGRANMDEFAFGSSCESSCYGPTRNPWDAERVPGGSSGGSAASVAADLAIASLGSDTGGSIRQPAAFCGVVGLKPTYGRVSRYGLIAFASSLDQIGPFTKDVRDCALLTSVLAGYDPRDSTSADVPVPDYAAQIGQSVKGLRVGLPEEYFGKGISPDVEASVRAAIDKLRILGVEVKSVRLPHTPYAASVYYVVAPSECSSNLARFDGVRFGRRSDSPKSLLEMYERSRGEGFGSEAKRRILLGTFALSSGYYDAYYLRAMRVRTLIRRDFEQAFKEVDALVTPTSPSTAFKIGEKASDPIQMYLSDIYTISANLAGVPALSLPCGLAQGLPVGVQLIGKPFDESTLFRLGSALEGAVAFPRSAAREAA